MKLYKNTNDRFGDEGPFGAESAEALAGSPGMIEMFRRWAEEAWASTDRDDDVSREDYVQALVTEMTTEFAASLEEVEG